jgi:hypothetical protein
MMLYLFLKGSRRHFSKDVSAIQFLILAQRPYKAKRKYKAKSGRQTKREKDNSGKENGHKTED